MVRMVKLYAISYQPYAKYARLASEIFLSSLQTELFQQPVQYTDKLRSFLTRVLLPSTAIAEFLSARTPRKIVLFFCRPREVDVLPNPYPM